MKAEKGDWVQVYSIILKPGERAPQVPDDTGKVPYEMWVKGYLTHPAETGEMAGIVTATGRRCQGVLTEVNPSFGHSFGEYVPELSRVSVQVKDILYGRVSDD